MAEGRVPTRPIVEHFDVFPDSRTKRTASSLNTAVYDRRAFVLMLSSDFLIRPLMKVSVNRGKVRM